MLSEIVRRLRMLAQRSRVGRDLDDEMRLHLELRQERLRQQNMSAEDAEVAARRRFGNLLRLREEGVDASGWRWLEHLAQDIRFGVRTLIRNPGFTLTAVSTLAIGIGANAAVFSVVSGVILRPLPFSQAERLVQLVGTSPLTPEGGPIRNLGEYRNESQSFDALVGYEVSASYLRDASGPDRVMTVRTERDFFPMLGVEPIRGRTYTAEDASTVAVIGERFWMNRLGGNPSVVGTSLLLDDQPFTIIGIMPESFQFPYRAGSLLRGVASEARTDIWTPFASPLSPRGQIGKVTGRLKANVSVTAAQSELTLISSRLEAQYPDTNKGRSVRIVPLADAVVASSVRRPLLVLFGAVGLVLALACANVANLSLVRMTLRSREVVVRSALGAGRFRLVRQFLTESLILSIAGGAVGLALAWWATGQVLLSASAYIPRAHEVGLDWRVFVFLFVVCTVTGIALGLAPAIVAGRKGSASILQESGGRSTMGGGLRRLRDGLVVAEVALAFFLAVGATLLIRELIRLWNTDPGMVTRNVVTLHVGHRRTPRTDVRQFYEMTERVAALPGVRAVGFSQMLPLQSWGWNSSSSDFRVRGTPPRMPVFPIELRFVTPGYFQALGIPVRRGRAFTLQDDPNAPPVIVINETLARRSFPGEDPVGKDTTRGTIVGVVGDVRQANLDRPSLPELYTAIAQNWSQVSELGLTLVVSTQDRPEPIIDAVRAVVRDVNPNLAIFDVKTMDRVVADSLSDFTLYLSLMTAAAGLALLLAITGTYGVISYIATSRTREFAIRVALGADRGRVTRLVVGQGARLTILGLGLGLCGALTASRWLGDLPVTVRPPDVVTTVPIALLIAVVAVVACLVPARRAAASDPIGALRSE
jgi:putative ABC transport system permease protein